MKKYIFLTSTILVFMTACGSSGDKKNEVSDVNATEESGLQCEGLTLCSEMESYEMAKFYLKN
jgi:hypothetical protein